MNNLSHQVVLITGASSGIGEATARLLSHQGAIVCLTGRRIEKLQKIVEDIKNEGGKAEYFLLDVTDNYEFQNVVNQILEKHGHIDVLIDNAGVMLLSQFRDLKLSEWNQMIDVNLKGVLHGIAAVLPTMRERKQGMILNVSSTAAYRVMESSAIYSATKFAVRALSDGLRKEESNHGIKVCLVAPGPTKTELLNHCSNEKTRNKLFSYVESCGLEANDVAEAIAYEISMPSHASIDELIVSPTHKM